MIHPRSSVNKKQGGSLPFGFHPKKILSCTDKPFFGFRIVTGRPKCFFFSLDFPKSFGVVFMDEIFMVSSNGPGFKREFN